MIGINLLNEDLAQQISRIFLHFDSYLPIAHIFSSTSSSSTQDFIGADTASDYYPPPLVFERIRNYHNPQNYTSLHSLQE